MNYYSMELNQIYEKLKCDPNTGLNSGETQERLKKYGKNEIPKVSGGLKGFIRVYLAPLFNWLIVIYLIGALLILLFSALEETADLSNIFLTLGIVAINMLVAVVQQFRATKKLKALRKLSAPTTTVIRNGQKSQVLSKDVVIGDILSLSQGAKVPADARIISAVNLEVNEASLTGESEPAKKITKPLADVDIPIGDRDNMLFYGTYITMGNCLAVVVATGVDTEIGKISTGLKEAGSGEIPIQKKMNTFGKWLGFLVLCFTIVVLLFKWISSGFSDIDVITALNSAMDIMPINIPLLTTIVMITGVLSMANHGVIIRDLTSVDSLGRISVVCSDKTGTLTQSKMCVQYVNVYGKKYKITGEGYEPEGKIFLINGNHEEIPIDGLQQHPQLKMLLIAGYLNNNASLIKNQIKTDGKILDNWDIIGSPTEAALVSVYLKVLKEVSKDSFNGTIEFPFDSSIKMMSKAFKARNDGKVFSYTKGASERLIPLCSQILMENGPVDFNDSLKTEVLASINKSANEGYRLLSIAYKQLVDLPPNNNESRSVCESNLVYLGYVMIADPPRDGVKESVQECYDAGVGVVMITGDSTSTAKAIASQLNIINTAADTAIEGQAIENIGNDEEFNHIKVFARVSPKNKEEIIRRYQTQKKVVAMTGDGVNDALALNMADAGIAMGLQGTDVAKEAADMVITDDSFNSIVKGIREGRGIFARIRAVIFFFIVINLFEGIVQFILTIILDMPYFLTGIFYKQWMFLSVTAHMFPGLALTFDTVSKDVMKEKPRDSEAILTKKQIQLMIGFGVLLCISMLATYFLVLTDVWGVVGGNYQFADLDSAFLYTDAYGLEYYFPGWDVNFVGDEYLVSKIQFEEFAALCARLGLAADLDTLRLFGKTMTMLMVTLFFCESTVVLQIRRPNKSLFKAIKEDSTFGVYLGIGFIFACFLALMYIPKAGPVFVHLTFNFMFMRLVWQDWLICFLISCICIFGFELMKYYYRKKGIEF